MNLYKLLTAETNKMVYSEFNERNNFRNIGRYSGELTFDSFVGLLDDYYTVEYSSKLGRTTFLVFKYFLILTRYDGYVQISYDDFISKFCAYGSKIGKTTLRNCIQELVDNDLICAIDTQAIQSNGSALNGTKIYGVVDKSKIIYQLCDLKLIYKNADIFSLLKMQKSKKKKCLFDIDGTYDETEEASVDEPKSKSKKKSNMSDKTRYKALMVLFKEIKTEMEEFFDFLGSYNKTGKIALSRKVNILNTTKNYADEDIVYAINLTMRNTKIGNNPYRERYFFKILKNLYDEDSDVEVNPVAEELSKKAEKKLKSDNKNKSNTMSRDDLYRREIERLRTINGYYDECISKYSGSTDAVGKKLFKVAKGIKRKFDAVDDVVYDNICRREKLLLSVGWCETITYDRKWNNLISYKDENGKKVSKEKACIKMEELGIIPIYTKYDIFV